MEKNVISNIEAKISILETQLLDELDENIDKMKAEHSARGRLISDVTVRCVFTEIIDLHKSYYREILEHLKSITLSPSSRLEEQLSLLIEKGLLSIRPLAHKRLKQITEFVKSPNLYQNQIPKLEKEEEKLKRKFENDLNTFIIELSGSKMSSRKPWEGAIISLWNLTTKGKRKLLTYPMVIVFLLVPSISGLLDSYIKIWQTISDAFQSEVSVPTKSELDIFDEWIIVIGMTKLEVKAEKLKTQFKES